MAEIGEDDMIRMPILVLGFERSGTTLLKRVVSMHPSLPCDLLHECGMLLTYRSKEEAEQYIKAGEKVAYIGNVDYIVEYVRRWVEWWPQSIVFHILRDAQKCAASSMSEFGRNPDFVKQLHEDSVARLSEINAYEQVRVLRYENLCEKPEKIVRWVYEQIGECPDAEHIARVVGTRDSWMHEKSGRLMCGLRYKERIGKD